jgi:hypothetical protein
MDLNFDLRFTFKCNNHQIESLIKLQNTSNTSFLFFYTLMPKIHTILLAIVLHAFTTPKAQIISEISGGIGINGISATITQHLSSKFTVGESISYMNWKPSWYTTPLQVKGLAVMHLRFTQAAFFLRWHPNGKSDMYGFQKKGFYLASGVFYKFNDDWITTSVYYEKRKRKNTITKAIFYETGSIIHNNFTSKIQPFIGMGFNLLGNDSKFTLQIEGGISYNGKPSGYVSSEGTIEILPVDTRRMNKVHSNLLAFPFIQIHLGYNYDDIHGDFLSTKF